MANGAPSADDLLGQMNAVAPPRGVPSAPAQTQSAAPSDDDLLGQMNAVAPPPAAPKQDADKAEAYGMMAPAFAPGTTGRDIANAFVGGIYNVGANVASNLGITPNPLPADVQATMAAHPYVSGAGNVLGQAAVGAPLALGAEVAAPAIYGSVGLGGAGWLPTLARGAITGGGLGAVQNALAGDPQEDLLTRARIGAEWGAPLGALGEGVGKVLGPGEAATATRPMTPAEMPPGPAGTVRLYHGGGDPASGGARWVTPDYNYARNWTSGGEVQYADVPLNHPAVQAATDDINVQPGQPPRVMAFNAPEDIAKQLKPVPTVSTAPPKTAAEAKAIASAYYDQADAAGGVLSPQVTNKFLDNAEATTPQTAAGRAVAGQSTTAALVQRLQALRDEPLSLQAAQEIDSGLGALVSKEYGPGGLSQEGKQLLDMQSDFRDQIRNAGPGDIEGGAAGFDAWNLGRQAWAQARKMDDLEQIMERASQTDNPATSIKSQVRTLINSKRSRGYDDDEMAALRDAANRGVLGGALHVFGSRLIPLAAGTAGAATGPLHAVGAALGAHAATAGVRRAAEALQARRLANVLSTVARGVPPNPLQPPAP